MYLLELRLSEVRNYEQLTLAPARGLNVLLGANAQGKSNLLEAIALLGTGKSFRTSREAEIIREGAPRAVVAGRAQIAAGAVELACSIERTGPGRARKTYTLNGEPVRFARFLGRLTVVTFVPADLELVSGPPARRRTFLNGALAQLEPQYYQHLARYRKLLAQKAAVLRGAAGGEHALLDVYDTGLARSGAALIVARARFVAALAQRAALAYARFGGAGEDLALAYLSDAGAEGSQASFAAALAAARSSELARRMPLVGPHRDELAIRLNGRPIGAFGSQGQQRSAVLALKLAEHETLHAQSGEAPLFLLDDVLSELDGTRARRFLDVLAGVEQVFLTATERPEGLPPARCAQVTAGVLHAC